MKIRTKIFALIGALSLIAIAVSAVSFNTLAVFNSALDDAQNASTRALYSERLNRLVTAVVMDLRGIYAAKDSADAQQYAKGAAASLDQIDTLLRDWAPLVPETDKALFERVRKEAEGFRSLRSETVRLGTQVSPQAAAEQGFTEANRSSRKTFQQAIDEITKRSNDSLAELNAAGDRMYGSRLTLLLILTAGGVVGGLLVGGIIGHAQIS